MSGQETAIESEMQACTILDASTDRRASKTPKINPKIDTASVLKALYVVSRQQTGQERFMELIEVKFETVDRKMVEQFDEIQKAFDYIEDQLIQRARFFFSAKMKTASLQGESMAVLKKHHGLQTSMIDEKKKKKHSIYALQMYSTLVEVKKTRIPPLQNPTIRLPVALAPTSLLVKAEDLHKTLQLYLPLYGSIAARDLSTLKIVRRVSAPRENIPPIYYPLGIAVHPLTGNVYTTEYYQRRIFCLDPSLNYINHFVSGNNDGFAGLNTREAGRDYKGLCVYTGIRSDAILHCPCGIAVSYDGRIAVTDVGSSVVVIMNDDYKCLKVLGALPKYPPKSFVDGLDVANSRLKNSSLSDPHRVCFDMQNNLYVADHSNLRIQKYDEKGEFVCSFTGGYDEPTIDFGYVQGVAVDVDGFVYMLQAKRDNIKVFTPDARLCCEIRIKRTDDPRGSLTIGPNNTLVVTYLSDGEIHFYSLWGEHLHTVYHESPMCVAFGPDGTMYVTSPVGLRRRTASITQYFD